MVQGGHCVLRRRLLQLCLGEQADQARVVGPLSLVLSQLQSSLGRVASNSGLV